MTFARGFEVMSNHCVVLFASFKYERKMASKGGIFVHLIRIVVDVQIKVIINTSYRENSYKKNLNCNLLFGMVGVIP